MGCSKEAQDDDRYSSDEWEGHAEWCSERFNVELFSPEHATHALSWHQPTMTREDLMSRFETEKPSPFSTRFNSTQQEITARSRWLAFVFEQPRFLPKNPVHGERRSATLETREVVGWGLTKNGAEYSEITRVRAVVEWDANHGKWLEITCFPDLKSHIKDPDGQDTYHLPRISDDFGRSVA